MSDTVHLSVNGLAGTVGRHWETRIEGQDEPLMKQDKADHLGPEYGAQFSDPSVAAAYHLRPPYSDETFEFLAGLVTDHPRTVLDAGAGTGEIARRLAPFVDRVDAVDPSNAMIERGKQQRGGIADNLKWIVGPAETAPLNSPYSLITAGASLHWMDWSVVLPRFRDALTSNGVLAIVNSSETDVPWQASLQEVINRYSTNRLYRPYDLIEELTSRNLFRTLGRHETRPASFTQSLDDYVESFHARNGFSLDRMAPDAATAFDREVAAIVAPWLTNGQVMLQVSDEIVWGCPAPI